MGGMSLNVGASFQTAKDDRVDSMSVAATVGIGGATVGASWYDNGDVSLMDLAENTVTNNRSGTEGFNVGAKYAIGALTPGITYSSMDLSLRGDTGFIESEATALAAGASYAVGGGLSVFAEYMRIDGSTTVQDDTEQPEAETGEDDETLLMVGAIVSF